MAGTLIKNKTGNQHDVLSVAPRRAQIRPLWAVFFLVMAVLCTVAYLDYEPSQSSHITTEALKNPNLVGQLGADWAFYTFKWFGLGICLIPVFLFWMTYLCLFRLAHTINGWKIAGAFTALVSASGLCVLLQKHVISPEWLRAHLPPNHYPSGLGGAVGRLLVSDFLEYALGKFGSGLVLMMTYVMGLMVVFLENPSRTIENAHHAFLDWRDRQKAAKELAKKAAEDARRAADEAAAKEKAEKEKEKEKPKVVDAPPPAALVKKKKEAEEAAKVEEKKAEEGEKKAAEEVEERPSTGSVSDLIMPPKKKALSLKKAGAEAKGAEGEGKVEEGAKAEPAPEEEKKKKGVTPVPMPLPEEAKAAPVSTKIGGLTIIAEERVERAAAPVQKKKGDYVFPTLELLSEPPPAAALSVENHQETADALVRTLAEFGVRVTPAEVHAGPVITRYEVTPAPGVRVEKIANLDKNIALGLKAMAVRILAPVPGKGTVGIEVPNRQASPVCLRDIIESRAWADSKAEIPVVLGKDVTGKPIVADLTKMPHMLIAGSTGSGKTVCINAIIASLLYHSSPDDLRFIMVDPKIVELQMYNDLPHMLIPVVTSPKKVPGALKWLISEMQRRYQIFAQVGVRNIAGFNAKILKDRAEAQKAEEMDAEMSPEERVAASSIEVPRDLVLEVPDKKLPYIVCIIDELADLMMVAPADIEQSVARLAQLARAAGIHLILATQRPSVNVITGIIKANLPTRIAFKVASKVDSRTILDQGGADTLIGRGDMLFIPPGTSNLVRAQGAYVSDEEITGIVEFLKRNGPPEFADDVQRQIETSDVEDEEGGAGGGEDEEWDDNLVPQALEVLRTTKRASTSMLQRRLRIGYNRAARIMEVLEQQGIVGPENGSSPREILKDLDSL